MERDMCLTYSSKYVWQVLICTLDLIVYLGFYLSHDDYQEGKH